MGFARKAGDGKMEWTRKAGDGDMGWTQKWNRLLALAVFLSLFVFSSGCLQPERVQVDFMYADWCGHCINERPVVEKVAADFGGLVNLTYWNEAARFSDRSSAAIYADYKQRGLFIGFPGLVAHGAKGYASLSGERNETEIRQWLCAQFLNKPAACLKN